ncbi:MAG: hypothetical protein Q4D66_07090 [Bacteroidales bacterium]|nr:hypothetical protein [Bacteroidales bacterium]
MNTKKYSLISLLFVGCALHGMAQCPIKDQIMNEDKLFPIQPDAVTGATSHTDHKDKAQPASKPTCCPLPSPSTFHSFRVGGGGEAVAAFKDYGPHRFADQLKGSPKQNRNTIALPRLVLTMDYKFSPRWQLSTAVAWRAGGAGQSLEMGKSANDEYHTKMEKGGKLAIEQFHLSRFIHPAFNLRAGELIVPVGLTNILREPVHFLGTVRPEGETTLLPSTWHETGLSAFGAWGTGHSRFDYEAMFVTGLNANGFDRNTWVAAGQQGLFEQANLNAPALVGRLSWTGTKGHHHDKQSLRLGVSYYHCADAGRNADKSSTYLASRPIRVNILTADAQYTSRFLTARGHIVWGQLSNSEYLSRTNAHLSPLAPYSRLTPVAATAVSYAGEAGLHLRSWVSEQMPDLVPFVRYEYYNPQQKVAGTQAPEARLKTSMWVAGLNYRVGDGIVLKADYTTRRIGDGLYNSENEWAVGIAFNTWFWSK